MPVLRESAALQKHLSYKRQAPDLVENLTGDNTEWKHLPQTTNTTEDAQTSLGSAAIVLSQERIPT